MSSLRADKILQARGPWAPLRSQRKLMVAIASLLLVGGGAAFAASTLFNGGLLDGPPAAAENDAALRALFPPYRIGHAKQLAAYDGRKLFGAQTAAGGYCFSATSPTDPKGEGGHCVSDAEARRLDAGGSVAFTMSGWSAGGYAPGASRVHITGAGIDAMVPVGTNGWWLGIARLKVEEMMRLQRLPGGGDRTLVVATAIAPDGQIVGRDPLMVVAVHKTRDGRFAGIGFGSI